MKAYYDLYFDVWRVVLNNNTDITDIRGVYSWESLNELKEHCTQCGLQVLPNRQIDLMEGWLGNE